MREEFEKLPEVKKDIQNYKLCYNRKLNAYTGLDGKIKSDAIWVNGALYAYQEQQKKIDRLMDIINSGLRIEQNMSNQIYLLREQIKLVEPFTKGILK